MDLVLLVLSFFDRSVDYSDVFVRKEFVRELMNFIIEEYKCIFCEL